MPIDIPQALDALASDDLIGLGMEAGAVRRRLHPERVATYTIELNVPADLNDSALAALLTGADRIGATGFVVRSSSASSVAGIEALLHRICQDVPSASLSGLTATDLLALSRAESIAPEDLLKRLLNAGLSALRGEDAALLDDAHRPASLCSSSAWLALHRTAHLLGLPSSASITFGNGEDHAARIAHLAALSALQAETGGFYAFTPHAWTPESPTPGHRTLDEATAVDYLKTLAVARLMLDTIPHLITDPAQGLKVTQMALRFGADDAGPVLTDAQTIALAGPSNCATEEELRRLIRDAGLMPVQRDPLFRTCYLV